MDPRRREPDLRRRSLVARQLLLVLAAVALLGTGSWDALRAQPAPAAAATTAAPLGATPLSATPLGAPPAGAGAERPGPPRALEVRGAVLAAAPAPLSSPDGPAPGPVGVDPQGGRSRSGAEGGGRLLHDAPQGARDGRGPPAPAGTDVTLPPRR